MAPSLLPLLGLCVATVPGARAFLGGGCGPRGPLLAPPATAALVVSRAAPVPVADATASFPPSDDAAFDWWQQWYPVALTRDLDSAVPSKVTLLGRDLVLWKEGAAAGGAWQCFVDRCPHRLAPLSEGRIDAKTGHLQCAYHGWEFEGSGACTKIPQMDPDAADTHAAMHSRRACATALPTQEAQGMVWVWPDTSEAGLQAAKVTSPNLMTDVDEKAMSYLVVCRDMPVRICMIGSSWPYGLLPPPNPPTLSPHAPPQYGVDTLLENGIDPSHLPFAHHNIISNRNQAAFIDIKVNEIRKDGFDSAEFFPKRRRMLPTAGGGSTVGGRSAMSRAPEGQDDDDEATGILTDAEEEEEEETSARSTSGRRRQPLPPMVRVPQSLHFRPPNLLYQVINVTEVLNKVPFLAKKERLIRIVTYAVPTGPGRSRVMYRFLRNYFLPPFAWLRWPPEWIEHQRILRVLDSDTVFLAGQERERLQLAPEVAKEVDKAYYMPTPADGSVRALRKWLARFGGPRWMAKGLQPPLETDRRVLLDRYESHTKTCKVCRGALRNLGRLRHCIGFLSVMAFYLGLLGQSVYTRLAGGFLTVLGITGVLIIKAFEERFYYQAWNHGVNH